uniref:Uncharacterized protein n=1 Tax=Arundo donax TaxID=35708 RepID=A0A0A9AI27_ARUDO
MHNCAAAFGCLWSVNSIAEQQLFVFFLKYLAKELQHGKICS